MALRIYQRPNIGFAGGEAVLRLELLCELIVQCKDLGLTPIVVSSGFWGRSKSQTERIISHLRSAGLDHIQLSLDSDHLKFIEIEHIATAVAACKKANFKNIKVMGTSNGNSNNFADLVIYLEQVLKISTEGLDLLDRNRVSHERFESEQKTYTLDNLEKNICKPHCLTELMIDVNGDVYPCCNNFVGRIGNLHEEDIESILIKAGDRSEFQIFQEIGPINYARRLDRELGTDFGNRQYGSWCEVCSRMFGRQKFQDLLNTPLSLNRLELLSFSKV